MKFLYQKYEEKFNGPGSKVKMDRSWEWYKNEGKPSVPHERYKYSIAHLYGNVLDVGSGDGFGAYLMSKSPRIKTITCLEIQDEAIKHARRNLRGIENVKIYKGIGEKMPFTKPFDSIHCGATLEHVFDDKAVLYEIKRLLGGIAVISVPIHSPVSPHYHIREYKSDDAFLRLVKEYLDVITYKVFTRVRIKKSTIVVIAKKKKYDKGT